MTFFPPWNFFAAYQQGVFKLGFPIYKLCDFGQIL